MGSRQTVAMRSRYVPSLLAFLRARNVDVEALARRFALPAGATAAEEIDLPVATVRALCDAAEQLAGDPWLGLTHASSTPRGAYGVLEFTARSAPTLRDALGRFVRYQPLSGRAVGAGRPAGVGRGISRRSAGRAPREHHRRGVSRPCSSLLVPAAPLHRTEAP